MRKKIQNYRNNITNKASTATQRAVSHSEPVKPIMSVRDLDTTPHTEENYQSFARIFWVTGFILVAGTYFVRQSLEILLLILVAYVLSVGLEGPIRWIQKATKRRGRGLFITYLLLIILLAGFLLIIPFIAEQLYIILTSVIAFINDIVIQIDTEGFASFIQSTNIIPTNLKDNVLARANNPNIVANVQNILAGISSGISQYVSTFFSNGGIGAVTQIFTNGLTIIRKITLVLVLSVFFSIEYKSVFIWIVKTVPSDYRTNMYHRMLDLYDKLQLRLKGQAFLMLYIFVISLIGFLVLRAFGIYLPQILLLALFAGMAEFIPYLGPILGGAPAVLLAIVTGGWIAGVIVIIMFRFIQWTENNIVVPVVMNKVLGVRSLVIFLTMVLATRLFGFVGILIAVPLSVIISVFSRPTHTPIQPTKPTSSFRHSTVGSPSNISGKKS